MVISKPYLMRHLQFRKTFSLSYLQLQEKAASHLIPCSSKSRKGSTFFLCWQTRGVLVLLLLSIFDSLQSLSICMAAVDADEISFLFLFAVHKQGLIGDSSPDQGLAFIHDPWCWYIFLLTEDREHNWAYTRWLVYDPVLCSLFFCQQINLLLVRTSFLWLSLWVFIYVSVHMHILLYHFFMKTILLVVVVSC